MEKKKTSKLVILAYVVCGLLVAAGIFACGTYVGYKNGQQNLGALHEYVESALQSHATDDLYDGTVRIQAHAGAVQDENGDWTDGVVTAHLDPEARTLTFTGNGVIHNHRSWTNYGTQRALVEKIIIGEGITGIDDFEFEDLSGYVNLKEVEMVSDGLIYIGSYAFYENRCLEKVSIRSCQAIEGVAFSHCYSLKELQLPENVAQGISSKAFNGCPCEEELIEAGIIEKQATSSTPSMTPEEWDIIGDIAKGEAGWDWSTPMDPMPEPSNI